MTAVETLKKMIEDGTITEEQLPLGCLKNEARAKKALKDVQSELNTAEDEAAYLECKSLIQKRQGILKMYSDASEGSVGDFLDALSGQGNLNEMPEQWKAELDNISARIGELKELACQYAEWVRDTDFVSQLN